MRKELLVCLLISISLCLSASAEAQLFRRWGGPVQQQPCPQQQAQLQAQQQRAQLQAQQLQFRQQQRAQLPAQQQSYAQDQRNLESNRRIEAPESRNFFYVEIDQQGRVIRQPNEPAQLARLLDARRGQQPIGSRNADLQRQQQNAGVGALNARGVVGLPQRQQVVALPGAQSQTIVDRGQVNRTGFVAQPVVTGYATSQAFAPTLDSGAGTQVDIARQTVVALPTLAGPVATSTVPLTLEPVTSIEPATQTPAGSLKNVEMVDLNVVSASANEDVPGGISILESSTNGVSVLESPESNGTLLSGPEGN